MNLKPFKNNFARWTATLSVAGYFFFTIMQLSLFNILSPFLLVNLKISSVQLGMLSSSFLYALAITLLPAGYLLDRYSIRKFVLNTLILSVASTLLLAVSLKIPSIIVYRIIAGMANGAAFLAALRTACHCFPKKNALASGLMIAFGMLGGSFASILFSTLFSHFGLKTGLFINFGFGFVFLCMAFLFFHPDNDTNKSTNSSFLIVKNFCSVAYNPQNWFCGIYTGLLNLSVYLLAALWGNLYLTERYHFNNTTAASIIAMIFFGLIIGSPVWGWFSDFIHSRKKPMFFGGIFSLAVILLILFENSPSVFNLVVLFFLLGFATASQVISYPTIAESNATQLISTATGFAALIINLIGAVAQPVFGWLLSFLWNGDMKNNMPIYTVENLKTAMLLLVVAFFLAGIIAFFIKDSKKQIIS